MRRFFSWPSGLPKRRRIGSRYVSPGDLAALFLCLLVLVLAVVQSAQADVTSAARTLGAALGLTRTPPSPGATDLADHVRALVQSRDEGALHTWSVEFAGVPVEAVEIPKGVRLRLPSEVVFPPAQTYVSEEGGRLLESISAYLSDYVSRVEVVAYAYEGEGAADPDVVSWERAEAVAAFLARKGFSADRIRAVQGGALGADVAASGVQVEILLFEDSRTASR